MAVSSDQRTDLGNRYVAEINRRIKVRTDAKVKVRNLPGAENIELLKAAQKEVDVIVGSKKHKLPVKSVSWSSWNRITRYSFKFDTVDEYKLDGVPHTRVPAVHALASYTSAEEADREKNKKLCQELEFLNGVSGGGAIGGFQSYVARLWSPATKSERLSDDVFRTHIEAFLNTKRGFTCSL